MSTLYDIPPDRMPKAAAFPDMPEYVPKCNLCDFYMIPKRVQRNQSKIFWSCVDWPRCRGNRPYGVPTPAESVNPTSGAASSSQRDSTRQTATPAAEVRIDSSSDSDSSLTVEEKEVLAKMTRKQQRKEEKVRKKTEDDVIFIETDDEYH